MENTPLSAINPRRWLVLTVVVAAQFICEQSERKHDGYPMLCVTAEVAYLTGQRREDVLGLPLRNVRDDGILFEQKKSNGEMRVVVAWTEALRGRRESEGATAPCLWPLSHLQQAWSALYRKGVQDHVEQTASAVEGCRKPALLFSRLAGEGHHRHEAIRARCQGGIWPPNGRDGGSRLRSSAGAPRPGGEMILEHLRTLAATIVLSD